MKETTGQSTITEDTKRMKFDDGRSISRLTLYYYPKNTVYFTVTHTHTHVYAHECLNNLQQNI